MEKNTSESRHYTPTPAVRQAVRDAHYLLAYAVQSKLNLADDVMEALIRAKNVLHQDAWTPEEEVNFWNAFTTLNAQVKPVTVQSLKSVRPAPDTPSWLQFMTRANFFLLFYGILTLMILVVLFVFHVYWFIGNNLLQKIDELQSKRMEITRLESAVLEQNGSRNDSSEENNSPNTPFTQAIARLDRQLRANYVGLVKWSGYWKMWLPDETTFEGKNVLLNEELIQTELSRLQRKIDTDTGLLKNAREDQQAIIRQRINTHQHEQFRLEKELYEEHRKYQSVISKLPSEFVLEVLQSYILPLLYGLLGAAIFVLRSATQEIEQVTYRMGSDIRYELRLALGALGGLAIGWFLVPEELSSFLRTVSPLALSLLVGYNIELLFSVMDSFIDKISQQPANEAKGA